MKIIITALACLCLLSCEASRTYMGYRVDDTPIVIADGSTIVVPMTDGGPIPAESDAFKIEVAGITVGLSKTSPDQRQLVWVFGLTSKLDQPLAQVKIEQVAPGQSIKLLVDDGVPVIKGKSWSGSSDPTEMSNVGTPWLFEKNASIFVFRFTIRPKQGAATVLYQASKISGLHKVLLTLPSVQKKAN